ncbi:MAG: hypothetical protein JRJ29_00260 [Deltaproteobacteria bacterium]|nr:hypothetical protein [Deltaproteobacteria bacterium]MBW2081596.1 hypothetical protein [Deltaproteobacteria bacterium]
MNINVNIKRHRPHYLAWMGGSLSEPSPANPKDLAEADIKLQREAIKAATAWTKVMDPADPRDQEMLASLLERAKMPAPTKTLPTEQAFTEQDGAFHLPEAEIIDKGKTLQMLQERFMMDNVPNYKPQTIENVDIGGKPGTVYFDPITGREEQWPTFQEPEKPSDYEQKIQAMRDAGFTDEEIKRAMGALPKATENQYAQKVKVLKELGIPNDRIAQALGVPKEDLKEHWVQKWDDKGNLIAEETHGWAAPKILVKHSDVLKAEAELKKNKPEGVPRQVVDKAISAARNDLLDTDLFPAKEGGFLGFGGESEEEYRQRYNDALEERVQYYLDQYKKSGVIGTAPEQKKENPHGKIVKKGFYQGKKVVVYEDGYVDYYDW